MPTTLVSLIDRPAALVVREHWRGGADVVQLAESVATIAPLLMPRRIARVLIAKLKPTAEGSGLLMNAAKFEPVLVETPEHGPEPDRLGRLADIGGKRRRSKSA